VASTIRICSSFRISINSSRHAENVAALMALYLEGRIKPAITERFPLARGAEAIARLGARDARGKLVVMIE
jgi:NADPH:quinone reductase